MNETAHGAPAEIGSIVEPLLDLARAHVEGRRVILAGGVLAAATPRVAQLIEFGAESVLVVAYGVGTGELLDPSVPRVVVDITATDVVDELRQVEQMVASPPPEVVAAVEAFDPEGDALVRFPPFSSSTRLGPRRAYGARRPEWVALEDKTTCDALFDAAGVAHPPSEVVPVEQSSLLSAANRLDAGTGTVWSGDASGGFNGGGNCVRWMQSHPKAPDLDEALDNLGRHCVAARVAPFIDGIPCSIHGVVCADGVAALRPVELVTLRRRNGIRLHYAGVGTFFDPPPSDRAEMRAAAYGVGELLASEHDFLGVFTIDGVLGADGWRTTELNPRFGAGLGYAMALYPELPFDLVHQIISAGDAPNVRAADIEALLIPAADDARWGGGWSIVPAKWQETVQVSVVFANGRCDVSDDDSTADGQLIRGPNASGGFVRLTLDADRVPAGPSIAPLVASALALADEIWDAGIGPLTPAPNVR